MCVRCSKVLDNTLGVRSKLSNGGTKKGINNNVRSTSTEYNVMWRWSNYKGYRLHVFTDVQREKVDKIW